MAVFSSDTLSFAFVAGVQSDEVLIAGGRAQKKRRANILVADSEQRNPLITWKARELH